MKNAEYNIIAKFYDKVTGVHNDLQDFVLNKIYRYYKNAETLLELGCGTGKNLENLQSRFDITGIDISGEMLKIARKKIPGGKFLNSDIRNFKLGKKFNVITCMYDTVNHLTIFSDWEKLFANVNKHLTQRGLFIFDINTLFKLNYLSEISPLVFKFDKIILIIEVKKVLPEVFNWNLKIFENTLNNNYKLHEINIKETSFDIRKIKDELKKYFILKNVETDSYKRISRRTERIYFICMKRETRNVNRES